MFFLLLCNFGPSKGRHGASSRREKQFLLELNSVDGDLKLENIHLIRICMPLPTCIRHYVPISSCLAKNLTTACFHLSNVARISCSFSPPQQRQFSLSLSRTPSSLLPLPPVFKCRRALVDLISEATAKILAIAALF